MNRAKVSLYEMLEAAHKSGRHGNVIIDSTAKKARKTLAEGATGSIVRKVSAADRIGILKTTLENLDDALNKKYLKIIKKRDYSLVNSKNPKDKAKIIKIMEDRLKNDQIGRAHV